MPKPVTPASPIASTLQMPGMGSFQEFSWLLEHVGSFCPVLMAEVEGETTVEDWQRAADLIQARHPLLSVSIRKESGQRPHFVPNPEPIRVRVLPMTAFSSLTEEMEKEQRKPFGDGSGVLTRITLLHGKDRSAVLLAIHHAIGDGRSNLLVMQDLLAAVAGEQLGPRLPPGPTGDQVLGFEAEHYTQTLESGTKLSASPDLSTRASRVRLHRIQLDQEETAALVRRAKAEDTTVHGALMAACVRAGRHYFEPWRHSVSCLTTIDLRSMMQVPTATGVLLTAHRMVHEGLPNLSFWEFARLIKRDLQKTQTPEGARATLEAIRAIVGEERTLESLAAFMGEEPSTELHINNYGNYNLRTEFQGLKLRSLSCAGPVVSEGLQNISAITLDGVLDLTHASMSPFPDFLEETRDLLVTFSHEVREPVAAGLLG